MCKMIYRKPILHRILNIQRKCDMDGCERTFEDGDEYVIKDDLFCDLKLCVPCSEKHESNMEKRIRRQKERELERKRADCKILAEEILKCLYKTQGGMHE